MSVLLSLACAACAPVPAPVPIETTCTVTDGDTIRCGDERIRLLGIDAPELEGHCRAGRTCAPGDPAAASVSLEQLIKSAPLRIIRVGRDRYGRTLGSVYAGDVNLSCAQIEAQHAIYRRDWDTRRTIARACADLTS